MGDSEDEFDRRNREKFRRERSDQYERRERDFRESRPQRWTPGSNGDMKRGGMRQMAGGMPGRRDFPPTAGPTDLKRRFSPGREEEMRRKRMRPYGELPGPGFGPPVAGWDRPGWDPPRMGPMGYRPPDEWGAGDRMGPMEGERMAPRMMTFKQWLGGQPDDITDEQAVKLYADYKIDFKRQQLQSFFIAHKDEEWFKEKYHPDDSTKRVTDQHASVKWRADVFAKLLEKKMVETVSLDLANEKTIIKLLDSAVIFMEGGTDEDLKILEMEDKPLEEPTLIAETKPEGAKNMEDGEVRDDKPELKVESLTEEHLELKKQAELYKQLVEQKPVEPASENEKSKKVKKSKRGFRGYDSNGSSDSSSSPSSSSGSDSDSDSDEGKKKKKDKSRKKEAKPEQEAEPKAEEKTEAPPVETQPPPAAVDEKKEEETAVVPASVKAEEGEVPFTPRALHRTFSIFMRNLPPTVNRHDIVNLCKKYPGFIRVAFSQPLEDHARFIRRCWATFDRTVNIKDICWNLNNIRLRDIELNPVVNRDLARRVRPISGIAQHVTCARNDLRNVARLIMHLDQKSKVWADDKIEKAEAKNPWLENVSQFLVDESSAEEEELVGEARTLGTTGDQPGATVPIERDDKLLKVLDKLLYYLRLVHSVDYYNASEYPNEDEMPNRCGIMHARGPIPPNTLSKEDIAEFQKRFNDKLVHILNFKDKVSEDEITKLGLKNEEAEVEKFVLANSQELGKDKWLCPLSGKKFKGPDYVRKHIFNKHAEKVDAMKKEVAYYNNYLMDPHRPGPPESQHLRPGPPPHPHGGFGPPAHPMHDPARVQFGTPPFHPRPPNPFGNGAGRTYPPKGRGGARPREAYPGRSIIEYHDLDAPEDTDFF